MSGKKSRKKKNRRSGASARPSNPPGGPAVRGAVIGLIVLTLAAVSLGAGFGVWKLTSGSDDEVTYQFPGFVYDPMAPRNTPKAYQAAIDYYDDFSKIPCYCGCGQSAGHMGLQHCFIDEMNGPDITFDRHGAG